MDDITIVYIEAILMPSGEVVSFGKSLGFADERQVELVSNGACKMTKGGEPVIAVGKGRVA